MYKRYAGNERAQVNASKLKVPQKESLPYKALCRQGASMSAGRGGVGISNDLKELLPAILFFVL